jgi:hypothetical protein
MTVRRSRGEVGPAGPSRPRGALGQRALPDSAFCGIADFCSSALDPGGKTFTAYKDGVPYRSGGRSK